MKPVPSTFYDRPTLEVARDLLGCELWVNSGRSELGGRIVEVEAYIGEEDPACHAHRGMTARTRIMYGPAGFAYVYFTYGNHWMLNFVTEGEAFPAAVLIRAIEPVEGIGLMRRRRRVSRDVDLTNGPGKLTSALGISGDDNGSRLQGPRFRVVSRRCQLNETVGISGRIGVNGKDSNALGGSFWKGILGFQNTRATPYARAASGGAL